MRPLENQRFLVVMRHEKSIAAVYGFASGLGASIPEFQALVMERDKDSTTDFEQKKSSLHQAIVGNTFDTLILATKINDTDQHSQILPFLIELKEAGLDNKPIILTHLSSMDKDLKQSIDALGLNIHIIENDNLGFPKAGDTTKRTGMSQLGAKILDLTPRNLP